MCFAPIKRRRVLSNVEATMKQRQSAQAGFSMIEMLIAVVILAVGLLGLAELQITATKANAHSESILAASAIAQEVIEDITSWESGDARLNAETGFENTDNHLSTNNAVWDSSPVTIEGGGTYNVTYDVVTRFHVVTDLSQVIVTVSSASAVMNVLGNRVRTVTATTIKRST